jgi:hypothetical protein
MQLHIGAIRDPGHKHVTSAASGRRTSLLIGFLRWTNVHSFMTYSYPPGKTVCYKQFMLVVTFSVHANKYFR